MNAQCENARSLVPSYLDGELSEEQAGPLRNHLLACPRCREVAKDGKVLGRWFSEARAAAAAVSIPAGFAARVARLAFAGVAPSDAGMREAGGNASPAAGSGAARGRPLLPFLLSLTAVAAAALFVLALFVRQRALPPGGSIDAGTRVPWVQPDDSEPRPEPSADVSADEPGVGSDLEAGEALSDQ